MDLSWGSENRTPSMDSAVVRPTSFAWHTALVLATAYLAWWGWMRAMEILWVPAPVRSWVEIEAESVAARAERARR